LAGVHAGPSSPHRRPSYRLLHASFDPRHLAGEGWNDKGLFLPWANLIERADAKRTKPPQRHLAEGDVGL
jgi:hypothetical protein